MLANASPDAAGHPTAVRHDEHGAAMRSKFHDQAPAPNILRVLWKQHRKQIRITAFAIAGAVSLFLVGRTIICAFFSHQAESAINDKNYAQAVDQANKALFFDNSFESAHFYKGLALKRLRNFPEALAELDFVLAHNPNNVDALYQRGTINVRLRNFQQTVDDCNKLLALRPQTKWVFVYSNRAYANSMLGNKDASIKDYTSALQLTPKDPLLYMLRGADYRDAGQLDKALQDLNYAIKLSPHNPDCYIGLMLDAHQ